MRLDEDEVVTRMRGRMNELSSLSAATECRAESGDVKS